MIGGVLIAGLLAHANIARLHNVQFFPTTHLPELGFGILLAMAVHREVPVGRVVGTVPALMSLTFVLVMVFVAQSTWWTIFAIASVPCTVIVGHLVLHRGSSLSRLLSGPPAVWLAERSYGFYLWHYPILITLLEQGAPVWLRAIAGLAGTFAVTELSWRYVEQPFLRRKRRFQRPGEVLLDVREPTSDMARLVTSR